ncbi:hydroxypyruvate isomerase family protein [Rathayibacter soli]|uniref:hydroxypyruvate isomerase family protein n=1 Tax=Rathayibacter soli TaxID=3144168 RepID=UPI0027E47504|nr:TIM barrel protein [Glaciibacter superstes]
MTSIAANLEWMFTEVGDDTADRIRAAAAHGLTAVEIWGWRDKNLESIESALQETGVRLLSLIVEPKLDITDPATRERYSDGVRESLTVARRLDARFLVTVAGEEIFGASREAQHAAVVSALTTAASILDGSNVTLLLENLNTKVDHVGTFLHSTREGLDIVREVDSSHLKFLLDAYHALVMEEDLETVIGDDIDLVAHVQVADAPGRHEPGTGGLDWAHELGTLRRLGYRGYFGMEYTPTVDTIASLEPIERIVAEVDRHAG